MKKIVIFLGAPGSGKGTQARKIEQDLGYAHFSTGDLLREMAAQEDLPPDERRLLDAVTKKGQLAPDSLIFKLAFRAMEKIFSTHKGIVLDGAIRSLDQAKEYQKFFKEKNMENEVLVIEVAIPDEESYKRLAHRRMCEKCGEILTVDPKNPAKSCPKCGGSLFTREDDSHDVVTRRISIQGNQAIAPIREYYRSLGVIHEVEGTRSVPEVTKSIEEVIRKYEV
jgi:adenylate kinase